MEQPVFRKTRIAPTPSGYLHVGNVLSFAVAAALARKVNATILLRIDDLDGARIRRPYVEDIFDTLHYLGIPWDEGPRDYHQYEKEYSQRHRLESYRSALQALKDEGQLFACNCSRTQTAALHKNGIYTDVCRHRNIPLEEDNVSWRLRTDEEKELAVPVFPDALIKTTLPLSMTDFVVRKKDGCPAYQLASVVDDHYFGIDLVVRGEDLWPSTIAQHYLSGLIPGNTFRHAVCYHHPLLTDAGNRKLSKSAGATSIKFLREEGKKPADIYSMIAVMLGYRESVKDFEALLRILLSS